MAIVTRHFATIGTRQVHYRRAGKGPPVFLLHPSPESSAGFMPLIARLADRYTAIAPDTPGNGLSGPLPLETPVMADFADGLIALMDELSIPQAMVYGFHTGALCALELARRHPDRFVFCVVNGYLHMEDAFRQDIVDHYFVPLDPVDWSGKHLAWLWSRMREQWNFFPWYQKTLSYRAPFDPPGPDGIQAAVMNMLDAGSDYRGAYKAAFSFDAPQAVQEARTPTLITCPRDDILYPGLQLMPKPADCVQVTPADTLEACEDLLIQTLAFQKSALPSPPMPPTRAIAGRLWSDTVQLDGVTLHLLRNTDGSGDPLVFIHKPAESAHCSAQAMRMFIGQRPVLAIDLPGHGNSNPWPGDETISIDRQAQFIARTLQILGYDRADIVGDLGGAAVAASLARQFPGLAGHLILPEVILPDAVGPNALAPDALATNDPDLLQLAPDIVAESHGGHLLKVWHMLRDQMLYRPWYDRRLATAITWREPELDADLIHQRSIALLKSAGHYRRFMQAFVKFPMEEVLTALECPVLIGCPQSPASKRLSACNRTNIQIAALPLNDLAAFAVVINQFCSR